MNNKLDNKRLNKLIGYASKLANLLYFLLFIGIILLGIFILKELNILKIFSDIFKVLVPIFLGFFIAWLFNPLVLKIEAKKVPKFLSIIIIYVFIALFIFLFFRLFIPVIYKQINDLISRLPSIISSIEQIVDKIALKFNKNGLDISSFKDSLIDGINGYTSSFSKNIPTYLINLTKSFLSFMGIFLMGLVIGIYLLIDYDKLYKGCIKLLPEKHCKELSELIMKIGAEVRKTVNGTLLVATMVFVSDTLAFSLVGLDSPLLFGLLCGFTDLIPFIGPYIGGAAAVIVGFSSSTGVGIAVLIVCIIVQIIENYILQPIVMSKATKLNPVLIIMFLLVLGHFLGILGMVISTPLLAIVKVVYDYLCQKRIKNQ